VTKTRMRLLLVSDGAEEMVGAGALS
jgi:hypothetical protein